MSQGVKTSEFWLAVLALASGVLLVLQDHAEVGGLLIAFATAGYSVSRGQAKKPPAPPAAGLLLAALALALLLGTSGCCSHEAAAESLLIMQARNEQISADESLCEDVRALGLANSDADLQVLYALGVVDELPPEVLARQRARQARRRED